MKATFSFSAGALVRRQAIYELKKAAQMRALGFSSVDDGGWFETDYCITVEGTEDNVKDYLQAVAKWTQGASTG